MNPHSKIVVVGSSNTDMIIQLDRIPRPGETLLGGEFTSAAGGKGANQAVGAARAGGMSRSSPALEKIFLVIKPSLIFGKTAST